MNTWPLAKSVTWKQEHDAGSKQEVDYASS